MASLALRSQKKALRSSMLAARKLLSLEDVRAQSERITDAVAAMPEFKSSKSVSCFLSMDGEVDTSIIVKSILAQDKQLFVPRMEDPKSGKLQMLRVYSLDDLSSLPSGLWGIREPDRLQQNSQALREDAQDPSSEGLDIIIMPGVAFDRHFSRLGYGKGFYDRFLSAYTSGGVEKRRKPYLVAVALREQVLPQEVRVPMDDSDWAVDAIVSPAFGSSDGSTNIVFRRDTQ